MPYPNFFSKWTYYLQSIITLLKGIRKPFRTIQIFLSKQPAEAFTVELYNGLSFKIRSKIDLWIVKETCLDSDYLKDFVAIEDGWTVIDIGAAFGDFAILIASLLPNAKVLAFEPFPESFELLEHNIKLNNIQSVTPFKLAVGSKQALSAQNFPKAQDPGNFSTLASSNDEVAEAERVSVEFISLSEILNSKVHHCDLLKLDCEGAEYDILLNAEEDTLRKIKHICLEYHEGLNKHSYTSLQTHLEEHGFSVEQRNNPVHKDIGFLFASRREPEVEE